MTDIRFLASPFLIAFLAFAAGATDVYGPVSGTWLATGNPYLVRGEIYIPANQTLTIQSGVQVIFQGHYKFIVQGGATLIANGSPTDSITFTAANTAEGWWGIRFLDSSPNCALSHCVLTYGVAYGGVPDDRCGGAIFCSGTTLQMTDCRVSYCRAFASGSYVHALGGGIYSIGSTINVARCHITNCQAEANGYQASSSGGAIYSASTVLNLAECQLSGNSNPGGIVGALSIGGGSLAVTGCQFTANGGRAITAACNALIKNSIFDSNYAGIYVGSPQTSSLVYNNITINGSQGIQVSYGDSQVRNNIIANNQFLSPNGQGAGLKIDFAGVVEVVENIIAGNHTDYIGGALYLYDCDTTIVICQNLICSNSAQNGGGIYVTMADPVITGNLIAGNTSTSHGAGIYVSTYGGLPIIVGNTIAANTASSTGGAIYSYGYSSHPTIINSIVWGNSTPQIFNEIGSTVAVTYSDVLGNWPGMGNINEDPSFINQALDDYRLLWGSPCIDTGDPNPIYNDPDGTRADMGAFYYDQSVMVRILLTPHEIPYLIPDGGGTMTYTLRLDTHLEEPQVATFWCDVTLPDSSVFGPLLGPATVDLLPNQMVSWVRYQGVPETAPLGVSHYNAYAVAGSDTSKDSFMFGVMGFGSDVQDPWPNVGDPLGVPPAPLVRPGIPAKFALHPPHPNPFNASIAISYQLSANSHVSLRIYDTAGRLAAALVESQQTAGSHEARFDGTDLPSGIYLCRLQAGDFEAVQKMVLLK
jgi:hypothetical protein